MGAMILDAGVLIGLLDAADAHHERAVTDVDRADRTGRSLATSASAYSEVLVAFARAGRIADARNAIAGMGVVVEPLTAAMAERAAELRAKHEHLRLPDAMALACAQVTGADLLSYDQRLARLAG
jgi:predicted nucleic acid-binding protein